jgi:hypothetical protein
MRAVCGATGNKDTPKRRVFVSAMSRRSARILGLSPARPASWCFNRTGPSNSVPEMTLILIRRYPSDSATYSMPELPFAMTAKASKPARSNVLEIPDSAGLVLTTSTPGSKQACQSRRADGEPVSGASKKVKPRRSGGGCVERWQKHGHASEPILPEMRLTVIYRMIVFCAPQPFPSQTSHIHFQQMAIGAWRLPTGMRFCLRHECDHRDFTLGIANDSLTCPDKSNAEYTHLAIRCFCYLSKV